MSAELFWQALVIGLGMALGISLVGLLLVFLYVQGVKARWWL